MVRLDADLIWKSPHFFNALRERELDLRGNKIAIIENIGATEDQFDTIDLSDNEIVKLENFPFMNRLGTLLINNNRITRINPNLGEFLPKMHTLVLTNNRLTSLAEIDPLASLPKLQFLSLLDNTVTKQPDYRLYVIHKLKHLHLLDFKKVKRQERADAAQKFHSKEAEEAAKKVAAKAYTPVVMDAQVTTKDQGPKVVTPTPAQITAMKTLKDEETRKKYDYAVAHREERTEAAEKFHSKEAEEAAKNVAAKAYTPVVMDAQGTTKDQGPKVVAPTPAQITAIKERPEAAQKFHSKEAEKAARKVAAKAYTPLVMDAQGTTKDQGPKVVAPTPAQITAIKERDEAPKKFHPNEAEEAPKKVAAKAYTPVVMDAQVTTKDQGPKVVTPTPAQITAMKTLKDEETRKKYDYAVAHPEERTEAAEKFHSKEAEEAAKKVAAKAYTPVVMDAQGTTKDQGPKVVAPTPAQITAIKALCTGQVTSEFALPKPDTNMAEASEEAEAEKMETDGQDQEQDGADEQKQADESAPIQEAFSTVQIHTEFAIRETKKMERDWEEQNDGADEQKQNEEGRLNTSIIEEMLGVGLDSTSTEICHIESYVYKNFQRAPFNFIFSWRKRPFRGLHIIPPPRRQEPGDCAYHATLGIMECGFKVKYARRGRRKNREFNVRLSHDHLKKLVFDFMSSEDGKGFRLRDKLRVCLMVAKRYGIVSEEDFEDGCPPGAVRYKIQYYRELTDDEKEGIPDMLDKAKMILTSFRVTPRYRRLLPHDIYRYLPAEDIVYQESINSSAGSDDKKPMHESHCVVLTNHGLAYPALEEVSTEAELSMPERYFEYLNSYSAGYGVDGSGYIYSDSIHTCYTVVV